MLSSSIETRVRGDENVRCGQLAQYRAERVSAMGTGEDRRRRRSVKAPNNYVGDIEVINDL